MAQKIRHQQLHSTGFLEPLRFKKLLMAQTEAAQLQLFSFKKSVNFIDCERKKSLPIGRSRFVERQLIQHVQNRQSALTRIDSKDSLADILLASVLLIEHFKGY